MAISAEDLIRRCRAAKTPAQESAVIETELSAIRSSFKLRDQPYIARNVAKLIYASMRGHSVVWGDMGIVNLCTSAKSHREKRLAYLALQLVPHDNPAYLKMASNSIKTDMESGSQYRASIAISALAASGTTEMLSELSSSTLGLIKNKESIYLRKKALIVALKTAKVAPEVAEVFIDPCLQAIQDSKSAAVQLAACQLGAQLIQSVETAHEKISKNIVNFVKQLNELANTSTVATPDNEIGGVNNPFLQVALLRLIQAILAKPIQLDNEFVKRQLADCLENIVSTQHKKGESVPARVSVQFEAAKVIMSLPQSLFEGNEKKLLDIRGAAADALTESLDHKNQTVRYSALAAITDIIHKTNETQGAQRHRNTVMQCMQEESITLRKRALNLLVLITDTESAKAVCDQLLGLIGRCDNGRYMPLKGALNDDIKREIISSVAFIAEQFAADPAWHFDTLFACLQLIGSGKANDDLIRQVTSQIAREKSIQASATEKLVAIFVESQQVQSQLYNETLMAACLYCIGECANLVVEPSGVINTIIQIVEGPLQVQILIRYAVSTVAKLYTKCAPARENAMQILQRLLQSADAEVQQRAYEYSIAINEPKAAGLLGAIPPPPRTQTTIVQNEYARQERQQVIPQIVQQVVPQAAVPQVAVQQIVSPGAQAQIAPPLQVMQGPPRPGFANVVPGVTPAGPLKPMAGPMMGPPGPMMAMPVPQAVGMPQVVSQQQSAQLNAGDDLLADLAPRPAAPPKQNNNSVDLLADLTAPPAQQAPAQQQVAQQAPVQLQGQPTTSTKQLYQDQYVSVAMKATGVAYQAECQFMITGFGQTDVKVRVQFAAPSGVQLKVTPPSGDIVGPNRAPVTQAVQISGGTLALKVKLQYVLPTGAQKDQLIVVQNVFQ